MLDGWTGRMYGFTVDNLLSAQIVLSDGSIVVATSSNEYSDLFWGLRGGSGNFGVVTRFDFKVYTLPSNCICGLKVFLAPTLASALEVCVNYDKRFQVCRLFT
jgi:FAD/FMN-containing dehydrogenase